MPEKKIIPLNMVEVIHAREIQVRCQMLPDVVGKINLEITFRVEDLSIVL